MPTSRYRGRLERQQGYAAARAASLLARELRGRKLSNKEARALTMLGSRAAGSSARSAYGITRSGAGKKRKGRRSAIRKATRELARAQMGGGARKSRKGRKSSSSRSTWAVRDSARSTYRRKRKSSRRKSSRRTAIVYGPVPFAKQSRKTRKTYLRQWKKKGYRRVGRYLSKRKARSWRARRAR